MRATEAGLSCLSGLIARIHLEEWERKRWDFSDCSGDSLGLTREGVRGYCCRAQHQRRFECPGLASRCETSPASSASSTGRSDPLTALVALMSEGFSLGGKLPKLSCGRVSIGIVLVFAMVLVTVLDIAVSVAVAVGIAVARDRVRRARWGPGNRTRYLSKRGASAGGREERKRKWKRMEWQARDDDTSQRTIVFEMALALG